MFLLSVHHFLSRDPLRRRRDEIPFVRGAGGASVVHKEHPLLFGLTRVLLSALFDYDASIQSGPTHGEC